MWLLKVPPEEDKLGDPPLNLAEFVARDDVPAYAILSHTWMSDEVLFDNVRNGTSRERKGYEKVLGTLRQARSDGFNYVWIDSCCIQKSSSAELQEAINSMYEWYRKSKVCYIYLEDVADFVLAEKEHNLKWLENFKNSRWFGRGWTLQELIAPRRKMFFSKTWTALGQIVKPERFEDKDESLPDLTDFVSVATGIDVSILQGTRSVLTMSIATRMSWMGNRECSREEDHAYSLLGIFGVSIPLLYGEGERAFRRLQEEILRQSDDTSIFRWEHSLYMRRKAMRGLLADSPDCFKYSQHVNSAPLTDRLRTIPYSMTNKGLSIHLPMRQVSGNVWLGVLDCRSQFDNDVLYLWRLLEDAHHFVRIFPHRLWTISRQHNATPMTIMVRQGIENSGLWGEDSLSDSGLHEDWLKYRDPVSHVIVDATEATTGDFSIESSWPRNGLQEREKNTEEPAVCYEVMSGWDNLFNDSPLRFSFEEKSADMRSWTQCPDSLSSHIGNLSNAMQTTPPAQSGIVDSTTVNDFNTNTEYNKYRDNFADQIFDDAVLLSTAICSSTETPHENDRCAAIHQKQLRTISSPHSVLDLSKRPRLCCVLKHTATGERIAVILSREKESIAVRAVPVGRISTTYHVRVEGTKIRFVDSTAEGDDTSALQVHMTLKLEVSLQGEPCEAPRSSHGCRACDDWTLLQKQLKQPYRLGKADHISLKGDCHQSERDVWLTISNPKRKKGVVFQEEVVEI